MQTQVQNETIENTIELAKLYGILKYLPDGQLTHAPFSLSPYKISAADLQEMTEHWLIYQSRDAENSSNAYQHHCTAKD